MRITFLLFSFILPLLVFSDTAAQIPALPQDAQTHWVVQEPEEIVSYLIFDPATVKERLPSFLRFITIGELAAGQISWAKEHLIKNPTHSDWGISFIEIVRMKTFEIDGNSPDWPEHGAAALWFARVAPSDSMTKFAPGRPFLALEFWMPDSMYVAYMRNKGHYASYGDVRLYRNSEGMWIGTITTTGLSLVCECKPAHNVQGSGSAGIQTIFPPANSGVTSIVRLAFAGHHEQECEQGASWKFSGVHPLVGGIILGPSSFEFGYDLIGGAYRH